MSKTGTLMEARALIAGIPLIAGVLSDQECDLLAANSGRIYFPPGQLLIAEGDFGSSMFIIDEGAVSVTASDIRGVSRPVAKLSRGDIVGEMSLMTGARRNATVIALSAVDAIEIPKRALEEILARRPDLLDEFRPELERRQAELDRILAEAKARWHVFGLSGEELVSEMRRFFAEVF
jgi:CRP-like cAMP-binding protein